MPSDPGEPPSGPAPRVQPRSDIQNLFMGSLRNTVHCSGCNSDFAQRDDFVCLPVPLPLSETKALRVHLLAPPPADIVQHGIPMPFWASVGDVLERLAELADIPNVGAIRLAACSGQRVRQIFPASYSISSLPPDATLYAFAMDLPCDVDAPHPPPRQEQAAYGKCFEQAHDVALLEDPIAGRTRLTSSDIAEMTGVTCKRARAARDACGGDANEAILHSLEASGQPFGEASAYRDVIALPPPTGEAIALTLSQDAIELPPPGDVVALPPPSNTIAQPAPPLALPAPEPQRVRDEDVQQVACVCGVEGAVARRALLRCGANLDRAVGMVLETPEALISSPTNVDADGGDTSEKCAQLALAAPIKRSASDPSMAKAQAGFPAARPSTPTGDMLSGPAVFFQEASRPTSNECKLKDAVSQADVGSVREALNEGADVCALDAAGSPLLHAAFSSVVFDRLRDKHLSTLRLLIDARANANAVDTSGRTVCHRLAECGADALFEELWRNGALHLDCSDNSGQTLLHKSAGAGHSSTVALLLRWGAQRDALDNQKQTPTTIATEKGKEDVLDELLERPRLLPFVHRMLLKERATEQVAQSADARCTVALVAKERGNEFLRVGDFPRAIEQYTLGISSMSDDESNLVADCYNNRAAAHMQLRNYENVVADTTQCLERLPANGKAFVRRAQAYQQLEKLKASLADATAAIRGDSLSASFSNIARTVHKEVRLALLDDGVDVDALDLDIPRPEVGAGVSNRRSPYKFVARPFIAAVPRSRAVSGVKLYEIAWRHATCNSPSPMRWPFELRTVNWDAEDDGCCIPCDDFPATLPKQQCVAIDWQVLPEAMQQERNVVLHTSAEQLRAEEATGVPLHNCLDALTEARSLTGGNLWQCPTCETAQEATTRSAIDRLPEVLVLHLKRFYYTESRRGKISVPVQFPVRGLDLAPWCLAAEPSVFDLFAVVNHIGGFGGGHYTACARPSLGAEVEGFGAWHKFDDTTCGPIPEEHVASPESYLLFYCRRRAAAMVA